MFCLGLYPLPTASKILKSASLSHIVYNRQMEKLSHKLPDFPIVFLKHEFSKIIEHKVNI